MDFVLPKKDINDYPGWECPAPNKSWSKEDAAELGAKYLSEHKARIVDGTFSIPWRIAKK